MKGLTVDWGKLATIVLVLAGTTLLGGMHVIDGGAVIAIYSAAAGYVFGNGRLAATGKPPQPMLYRPPAELVEDLPPRQLVEGEQ